MAIRITKHDDIYLSATELVRYRYEYEQAFRMYCGPRPDFEEWVAQQIENKKARRARCSA